MGPSGAPIAVVTRANVYRHHPDCLKTDLFSTSKAAPGAVGRPRLGESDVVSTIGASRTIPVVDPTHWEATRATFRSRLFHRRRSPCTTHIIEMLASNQRTRLRSHPTALRVGAFHYMLACVGQRGSRSRQTGAMVYRMGRAMEGCRPWIGHGSIWDRRGCFWDSCPLRDI